MRIETYRQAGQHLGIAPATVRNWVRVGRLPEPPWTVDMLEAADREITDLGQVRGITSAHGTTDRWSAGCTCDECRAAHNQDTTRRHRRQRAGWWAEREDAVLEALADGPPYRDALQAVGVTWQAITRWRRVDEAFAERVDVALTEGRPDVAHGRPSGWRAGCRCPECRKRHEASRTS